MALEAKSIEENSRAMYKAVFEGTLSVFRTRASWLAHRVRGIMAVFVDIVFDHVAQECMCLKGEIGQKCVQAQHGRCHRGELELTDCLKFSKLTTAKLSIRCCMFTSGLQAPN
ncbi:hypothetical protein AC1031_001490 [Aphanomyces cochlioides]|nr:hypothetical protein AC1031_001490 [Aphanomyces cochlioides]